jgi:hypothetical protein
MPGSRKKQLQLLAMIVVATALSASAVAVGLGVIPSSVTSANDPARVFSSGASAIFTSGDLVKLGGERSGAILGTVLPQAGERVQGTVTVEHRGDTQSEVLLSASTLVDGVGPTGDRLSGALRLTVVDRTTGLTVYDGTMDGIGTVSAGVFEADEAHDIEFVVSRIDNSPATTPTTGDSLHAGSTLKVALDWSEAN